MIINNLQYNKIDRQKMLIAKQSVKIASWAKKINMNNVQINVKKNIKMHV